MTFMERVIRTIVTATVKPGLEWYLKKPRSYRYHSLRLRVDPGVFHPGFFFSTKFFVAHLAKHDLRGKRVLELGCGSGLLALAAARQGARVTASDINPAAVENTRANFARNPALGATAAPTFIQSDLFENFPVQAFDYILVNPPYYRKDPADAAGYAWYCGAQGDYFRRLFRELPAFLLPTSVVLMCLSDDCDLDMIRGLAAENGFALQDLERKKMIWEWNFIVQVVASTNRPSSITRTRSAT